MLTPVDRGTEVPRYESRKNAGTLVTTASHSNGRFDQFLTPRAVTRFIRADDLAAELLGDLFREERAAALRTRLEHRPVPHREVALRVIDAAEKHFAAPRLL